MAAILSVGSHLHTDEHKDAGTDARKMITMAHTEPSAQVS